MLCLVPSNPSSGARSESRAHGKPCAVPKMGSWDVWPLFPGIGTMALLDHLSRNVQVDYACVRSQINIGTDHIPFLFDIRPKTKCLVTVAGLPLSIHRSPIALIPNYCQCILSCSFNS